MKLGIMSDTHDRLEFIGKAVEALNGEKVDLVLHAGDFVSPFTAGKFRALKAKMVAVFGNNDGDRAFLRKKFAEIGVEIKGDFALIDADGMKVGMLHGNDQDLLDALSASGAFDVLVYGHTHEASARRRGRTLLINGGEVCGYLSSRATIAVLDTRTLEHRVVELARA
ncbi:MAG: metallophosphoesterase [Candidatus Brockarchaeota archaeon]|nr:metallophosphoesterase [Candidatus Brockarchaeota archaeon]